MAIKIDLRLAVYALSDALDLVGVDEVQHGKRVGFMALQCGRSLGWDERKLDEVLHAGLLHDCGVSSTAMHRCLVQELDWDGSQEHCLLGERLLNEFAPLAHLAPVIRYHHSHWDVLRAEGVDAEIARMANLIFLVDRVDALAAPHYGRDLMLVRDEIRQRLSGLAGSFFDPELVKAFLEVSVSEAFWYSLEPRHMDQFLWRMVRAHHPVSVGMEELRQFASLFARVVDAKSRFTWEHSEGVAHLARGLARWVGLSPERCDLIEIAGLLHDLGKLQVPDEVLEKPGLLDRTERAVVNRHSFETYQILNRIPGLEEVAKWAACHHEALNGAGYPFHYHDNQLPLEARIIAVADIFQALSQHRPYREPLTPAEILRDLRARAAAQRVDGGVVDLVAAHLKECHNLATGAQTALHQSEVEKVSA